MSESDDTSVMPAIISLTDARAAGLKHYYTGKPCNRGHVDHRFVNGSARMARAREKASAYGKNNLDKRRARYAADPEKGRARTREHYAKNREKILKQLHDDRATDPEKYRQKYQANLETNRARSRANAAKYRAANPGKAKAWAANNPERMKALRAKYSAANREKRSAAFAAWASANAEKLKERRLARYAADPEKYRAKSQAWYAANTDKSRQTGIAWREANPEKLRLYWHRRRALKASAEGSHTVQDIKDIYSMQKGKCAICRDKVGDKYHVDHIQPLSKGGSNARSNLQITCRSCNARKKDRDPLAHMQSLGFLL